MDHAKLGDENVPRIRESSRSVDRAYIFLDQYMGCGVFIPRDKFIRIGLFRNVNRPFVASESRVASHSYVAAIEISKTSEKA